MGEVPADARLRHAEASGEDVLTEEALARVRALNDIAAERGQSLAQMALAWCLRDSRVTSVLIGASRAEQIRQNVAALDRLDFSEDELKAIERHLPAPGDSI